ncbi:hypothetical protein B0A69_17380 [Chryseobacterium shigense]|uniref:Uncharacterized protein n=1 Tax=Chryseobacterium shigense TaxID=297244 RepID=A0A1N7IDB6_9FLAO|nr:hypothetical protein [Chryseobacterium shigense]PQA91574.1 hypothetical protein B0A69_17380 [Chryseobacterium shigense]SIS35073.1 hypothetical protein SAMN05421639_103169 [Chryseobacterium shigense]
MKHSFLTQVIFYILFFCFSVFSAQKITIVNNTTESFTVQNGQKEVIIKDGDKKEFSNIASRISVIATKNLNRSIIIFLEPTEKLTITIKPGNTIFYTGDQAEINEYLNEKLNVETFGKMKDYLSSISKKNVAELKNTSEIFLSGILKKLKLSAVVVSPEDKASTKKIKNHIKYNWLYTLLSTVSTQKDKTFTQQAIHYYYKKYIESDITQYSCSSIYQYNVIEIVAKNKELLPTDFPTYPIVSPTDSDNINQYLPKNCQKFYFQKKYDYLEHINDPGQDYYKKVLTEKFSEE